MSGVYNTINQRRGVFDSKEERPGTPICKVKAFLPVLESFGFTQLLRQNTSGQAFPQMMFSHWQVTDRPFVAAFFWRCHTFGLLAGLRCLLGASDRPLNLSSLCLCVSQPVSGDAFETGSAANKIIFDVRKRKGLKAEMPDFADYYGRLSSSLVGRLVLDFVCPGADKL